jgi:hypothetical protein
VKTSDAKCGTSLATATNQQHGETIVTLATASATDMSNWHKVTTLGQDHSTTRAYVNSGEQTKRYEDYDYDYDKD